MTREEFIKRWPNASESTIAANCSYGVASRAFTKRGLDVESVDETSRKSVHPRICIVRVESHRLRLIDGDNLHAKAFVDALQYAGAIYSDAPAWCEVKVSQVKVDQPWKQKTVIEIEYPD